MGYPPVLVSNSFLWIEPLLYSINTLRPIISLIRGVKKIL